MKDKLLYRSQFQPAPRSKYDDDYGLPSTRRRSPYRSASRHMRQLIRNFLRLSIIILLMLFFDRVTGWRNSSWCQRWLWGKGIVKSAREWRQGYYSLDLGLKGLPEGFNLPNGDEIPSVGLGTWKASSDDVGGAIKVSNCQGIPRRFIARPLIGFIRLPLKLVIVMWTAHGNTAMKPRSGTPSSRWRITYPANLSS